MSRRAWPLWCTGVLSAVLVALTVAVVAHPGPLPGEVGYVRWLQARGEPLATIADVVRTTTGTEAGVVVAIVFALFLGRRSGRAAFSAVGVAVVVMLAVQPIYKEIVDRPRPDATQVEVRAEHTSKSFPSGHSLSTTTVWGAAAGVAWTRRRRVWAAAAAVPVVLTGVSSAVQGVHWPSDALAGTIIGGVAALLMVRRLDDGVACSHPGEHAGMRAQPPR